MCAFFSAELEGNLVAPMRQVVKSTRLIRRGVDEVVAAVVVGTQRMAEPACSRPVYVISVWRDAAC